MKKPTRVNHPPEVQLPAGNRALVAPLYQSVKFEFADMEDTERHYSGQAPGFSYSRASNPTVKQLELLLAELQGREAALVTGSGVAAVGMCLLSLLKQGDHVLCFIEMYGPTHYLVKRLFARYGVTHTLLSIEDLDGVERALAERPTRMVLFESPTNPVTRIADIPRLTALARRHGAMSVLDNTFAGLHQHGEYDIDIYVHSLTKFASGHGDVMGGAVIAGAELIRRMRRDFVLFGAVLDPHAAWLIQRGLKTYFVRCRQQCASALIVARWLAAQPQVGAVHYPGLDTHPQHALAVAQMQDFGSVVSFQLRGGFDAGRRFADALQLFAVASSVGSTDSLVLPARLLQPRELTDEQLRLSGITPDTVRLSIGLEDTGDLIADLEQAMALAQ